MYLFLDSLKSTIYNLIYIFRTTANGVLMGVGRIAAILGNVVFGQLVDVNCMIPMVMVSSLLCLGGLISLKLPNSQSIDLG